MEMVSTVQTNRRGRRRKIEMKKIEKKTTLEVAFSKRRSGLFKKAGEICILCGAQVAVIVFSPGKKAYTFGHPSVDVVLDRLLYSQAHGRVPRQYLEAPTSLEVNGYHQQEQEDAMLLGYHGLARGQQYNSLKAPTRSEEIVECGHSRRRYVEAFKMLQVTKGKRDGKGEFWWDLPFENMGLSELEQFKASLEELRKKGISRVDEMTSVVLRIGGSSPSPNAAVQHAAPPTPPQQHCSDVGQGHDQSGSSNAPHPQEHASPTSDGLPDFGLGL